MTATYLTLPPSWLGRHAAIRTALVGAGGNGSEMGDRLGKLATILRATDGPRFDVTVFDGDTVSASNCGRQRFTSTDIGMHKATMLVHRLNAFYGQTWRAAPRYAKVDELTHGFDLIITAVDKALFRAELGQARVHRRTLWMDLGNGALQGNVVIGHLGDSNRGESNARSTYIPNVFDLFPSLASMGDADRDEPSCSTEEAIRRQALPINPQCADLALQLLYFLLREQKLSYHGFQFRLHPMQVTPIACDAMTWAFFGWGEAAEANSQEATQGRSLSNAVSESR